MLYCITAEDGCAGKNGQQLPARNHVMSMQHEQMLSSQETLFFLTAFQSSNELSVVFHTNSLLHIWT